MSNALKEMKNVKGFFSNMVGHLAKAHATLLEGRVHKEIKCPSAQDLEEEYGGLIKDSRSSCTRGNCHVCTMGLFWSIKALFCMALDESRKGKKKEAKDMQSILNKIHNNEIVLQHIACNHIITNEQVNSKLDVLAHELTGKHFSRPPPSNPTSMQLIFYHCPEEIMKEIKIEFSCVGLSLITISDDDQDLLYMFS